ncbi:hypothetical protein UMZ34_19835 [Halopseudomonas pachastrellae]|nr:hypothetical protein UMZ34_19835 [Halopseudomonas pachastrellae]
MPVPVKVLGWALAAFAFAIFAVTFNNSGMVLRAGFFAKAFAVLVGTLLGWGGALLGDAICRFAARLPCSPPAGSSAWCSPSCSG